jgi:hypothetical protein
MLGQPDGFDDDVAAHSYAVVSPDVPVRVFGLFAFLVFPPVLGILDYPAGGSEGSIGYGLSLPCQ